MPNLLPSLLAVAAAAFTVSGPANADSAAYSVMAPVTISSITVDQTTLPRTTFYDAPTSFVNAVAIIFANKSSVTATAVTFVVNVGGYAHSVVDKGTFSPGAQVQHEFSLGGLSAFSNPEADVSEIDFADGSSWHKSSDLVKR